MCIVRWWGTVNSVQKDENMKKYADKIDKVIENVRSSESIGDEKKDELISHLETSKVSSDGLEKFIDTLRVKFEDIWEDIEPIVNELGLR